jgi:hypothetical protein
MKKMYIKATMEVVKMETEQHLLVASADEWGDEMACLGTNLNRFA